MSILEKREELVSLGSVMYQLLGRSLSLRRDFALSATHRLQPDAAGYWQCDDIASSLEKSPLQGNFSGCTGYEVIAAWLLTSRQAVSSL